MMVDLLQTSIGCNRVVQSLSWSCEGLLAYAAHNTIAVCNPEVSTILTRLKGHTDRVNSIQWLPTQGSAGPLEQGLVSGGSDGYLIVWRIKLNNSDRPWEIAARLQAHEKAVTSLAVHVIRGVEVLLVSTSADDSVAVWTNRSISPPGQKQDGISQERWRQVQSISMPLRLQHAVAIIALPSSPDWKLIALGGVDNTVRLLLGGPNNNFVQVCTLTGHSNWVRSLAFTTVASSKGSKVMLASASQDKYIRIWGIAELSQDQPAQDSSDFIRSIARYAPRPGFKAVDKPFVVSVEAMLIGHEDWVHSVAWQPGCDREGARPCLLSASMDRTMAIWRPDDATGLWMSEESVGDAGPSNLGYYGGVWGPAGKAILAHGYTGALHLWYRRDGGRWEPRHSLGGHVGPVVDLSWGFGGRCLLSASTDQTARILTQDTAGQWLEIARPQVHGHDFSCICSLPLDATGKFRYASGAEEKVIRILEAPQAFLHTLASIRGETQQKPPSQSARGDEAAFGAAVPALGLSNKAIYLSDSKNNEEGPDLAPVAQPASISERPLEEHLQQSTLWPEVFKVYGHGNEIFALAAAPEGGFLASACKAQSTEFAAVWIWKLGSWSPLQRLECHTLTVTQLAFSPSGSHLVSVSRDRSLAVWKQGSDPKAPFNLLSTVAKAHTRIIWTVSCSSACFATGSRDNFVKVWALDGPHNGSRAPAWTSKKFGSSVQSVAFAPDVLALGRLLLAVGLEDGNIQLLRLQSRMNEECFEVIRSEKIWEAPLHQQHSAAVRHLAWQATAQADKFFLASAGDDHAIHVYEVKA